MDYFDELEPSRAEIRAMLDMWPVLLRILNRKMLTDADRNDLRFATQRREDEGLTFAVQMERALSQPLQARDDKRKRPGEN
jgi:hypothetical protein